MSRTVMCRKYRRELDALDAPPYPGPKGQEIYQSLSRKAWTEWLNLQTMLINEKHLSVRDPQARAYLGEQMEKFFNNENTDHIEGYTAPPDNGE